MSIPIEKRDRPATGMGSASPRYELYTACCDIFLAADDSLDSIQKNADRHGVKDLSKLVIYDRGPKR